MKILYVCPFAHYSGHHPHVAVIEPKALAELGHDVTLLTFQGVTNSEPSGVPEMTVLKTIPNKMLKTVRRYSLLRWPLMVMETLATLGTAVSKKGIDVVYVRDGDPFLFGMFLIGLMKWKMPPVYISVTGSVLFAPESEHKGLVMKVYVLGLKALGSAAWRPLYSAGVWRKNVTLIAQNKRAVEAFQKTAHGVFRDKVVKVERGVEIVGMRAGKELSRQDLGIHPLRFTLLSFGAPHQGKNLEIVFGAVARTPHIQILHGGLHSYSLGGNPAEMAVRFGLNGRATVHDRFVLEKEKPLFFGAADAVVLSYTRVFQSTSSMLYDAAAFGVPVIASDNSPLGELVKENGLGIVFKAEDVRSLVEAIEKFRGLEWGKVEEMKRNCLRFAKENGIDRWARECVKLFEGGREKSGEMVERKWGKGA